MWFPTRYGSDRISTARGTFTRALMVFALLSREVERTRQRFRLARGEARTWTRAAVDAVGTSWRGGCDLVGARNWRSRRTAGFTRLHRCHARGLLPSSTLRNGEIPRACKRAHHEPLDSAADFDLVAGGIAEVDASAHRHGFGDHELAGVGLGEGFDAARRVDGVADGGDRDCGAVTHFAHDGGAGMDADADPQRLGYVVNQRAIEGLHALGHV